MTLVNNMTIAVLQFPHNTNKIHIYEYTLYNFKTRKSKITFTSINLGGTHKIVSPYRKLITHILHTGY